VESEGRLDRRGQDLLDPQYWRDGNLFRYRADAVQVGGKFQAVDVFLAAEALPPRSLASGARAVQGEEL
jgi:hypothetical protein